MTIISYEIFQESIQELVREVAKDFSDPQEDWRPMLAVFNAEGLKFIEFEPRFLEQKPLLWKQIEKFIATMNAEFAAFICSAWVRHIPKEDVDDSGYLKSLDKTVDSYPIEAEVVQVTLSDGNTINQFTAEIERHESSPPTLKAWDEHTTEDASVGGAIPRALERGFKQAKTS